MPSRKKKKTTVVIGESSHELDSDTAELLLALCGGMHEKTFKKGLQEWKDKVDDKVEDSLFCRFYGEEEVDLVRWLKAQNWLNPKGVILQAIRQFRWVYENNFDDRGEFVMEPDTLNRIAKVLQSQANNAPSSAPLNDLISHQKGS